MNEFQKRLAEGQVGERAIAKYMIEKRGCSLIPICDLPSSEYRGPRLANSGAEPILPDLLVFKGSDMIWIETKTKSVFTWHRISQKWTTGIDMNCYVNYQKIQEMHQHPVWLLFLHMRSDTDEHDGNSPTGLYGKSLHDLMRCESHRSDKYGKGGMVYWGEKSLIKIEELADLNIPSQSA